MKKRIILCLAIVIHLWILKNLRFEVWPEMMLMPYLMKNGFELYRDMIAPWTPGLMWILTGWFGVASLTVSNLKIFTWLMIILIDVLVYLITQKKWGSRAGLTALFFFVLLQPLFDGNGMWFDLAITPLLLLTFHFNNPIFLGPAFLIKQSVIWLFPLFYRKWKELAIGVIGAIGLSGIYFWLKGSLMAYWYWAYDFTFRIFPSMPGHKDLGHWRQWILALAPFALVLIWRLVGNKLSQLPKLFIRVDNPFAWAFFLIFFSLPRFGLFHFQPAIAFLSMAIAESYSRYKNYNNYKVYFVTVFFLVYLVFSWGRLVKFQWRKNDRFLEPEVYQLAARVALETDKSQPVLLVNSSELVYVLADRLPPKPWLTQFPWFLELPGFQEKLIDNFKKQNLQQVIYTDYYSKGKFVPGSYQPDRLLKYLKSLKEIENE